MRKTFVLAVAAVALSGCGMLPTAAVGSGGQEKQVAASNPPAQSASAESSPAESSPVENAAPSSAPPQANNVIASHEAKVRGVGGVPTTVRVEVTELRRQGRIAVLRWRVTTVEGKFNLHNGLSTGPLNYTVSGVSLVDPVNAKRYRVARNGTHADAACVCSRTQGAFMEKGERMDLYAFYAAPPADVTKLTVEMPQVGVINDVPVS
jgi:hypothetical protein